MSLRSVAIVGRPNVGKSSLFNRMLGRREAIVADLPGVTRDVKEGVVETDDGSTFTLLDTGGLWSGDVWEADILRRVEVALTGVDLVLFVIDARDALSPRDHEVSSWLRKLGVPVVLVANKIDDPRHVESNEWFETYGLGWGEPHAVSAMHGAGIPELQEKVLGYLQDDDDLAGEEAIRVAIVGRPNVGKSSILNAILGYERTIVADEAGTTRDSIDVAFDFGGRPFVLIDTAGLRRKPDGDVEFYAKLRSEAAIRRCDVAILVVDPFELGDHEMKIANLALEVGRPVVMAVNKWDLVEDHQLAPLREKIDLDLEHLNFAPRVYTSALTDYGLHELLASVVRVYDQARQRVPTGTLNAWMKVWTQRQTPPNFNGRSLNLLYGAQPDVAPPTFVFSVNSETLLTRAYEHYLRNRIREDLGFPEVPIRMVFKHRDPKGGKRVRV